MPKKKRKIDYIPVTVMRSGKIKKLVNERCHILERYAFNSRRVNPQNPKRSQIEKERTKIRKRLLISVREVSRELMFQLETIVHHPDVYVPDGKTLDDPLDRNSYSEYRKLIRRWKQWRPPPQAIFLRRGYDKTDPTNNQWNRTRQDLVIKIMTLETSWLNALQRKCFPNKPLPPKLTIHPSRFKP